MLEIINFLESIGTAMFNPFWFPVLIWTIVAIPIILLLRKSDALQPVYQYHSRVALLLALPLGILGSYGTEMLGQILTSSQAATTKFIVIQNPITVSAAQTTPTFWESLASPMLWIGLISALLTLGALYYLIKLVINALQLKKVGQQLSFMTLKQMKEQYMPTDDKKFQNINPLIAFSEQASVPFTYGWIDTKIVIPAEIKNDPEKTAMAIRHELMHIKHRDFLLNGVLMVVKALFWFHPLSHYLYRSSQEYREITCDGQVLADTQFSKKRYANLLFELAEREYRNSDLAMSMAVNPSSLKKRIQIMSTQNISTTTFRSSFMLTLATATLVVLTISCSDLSSEDGITNTEFQQAQSQLSAPSAPVQPLYIINGEKITRSDPPNALSRIKGEYIKSINVFKGEEAINKYGEEGRNGVVKIQLHDGIDKDMVFSDLKEKGSVVPPPSPQPKEDFYVAVEEMPELIGGLAELQKEIIYPEEAREAGIEGRVIVVFIVNEQGEVEKPEIMRGVGGGLDKEALRVVKEAKFKPGLQRGQPVRVQYSLPIIFRLAGSGDDTEEQSTSSVNNEKIKSGNSLEEIAVVGYAEVKSPEIKKSQMKIQNLQLSTDGSLSGVVVNTQENKPLPGTNVIVKGTTTGTSTNMDGEFTLQNLPTGEHELVISRIGYQSSIAKINVE